MNFSASHLACVLPQSQFHAIHAQELKGNLLVYNNELRTYEHFKRIDMEQYQCALEDARVHNEPPPPHPKPRAKPTLKPITYRACIDSSLEDLTGWYTGYTMFRENLAMYGFWEEHIIHRLDVESLVQCSRVCVRWHYDIQVYLSKYYGLSRPRYLFPSKFSNDDDTQPIPLPSVAFPSAAAAAALPSPCSSDEPRIDADSRPMNRITSFKMTNHVQFRDAVAAAPHQPDHSLPESKRTKRRRKPKDRACD